MCGKMLRNIMFSYFSGTEPGTQEVNKDIEVEKLKSSEGEKGLPCVGRKSGSSVIIASPGLHSLGRPVRRRTGNPVSNTL